MTDEFLPGDRVQLKSGGPNMTVIDQGRATVLVWCCWEDAEGNVRERAFPSQALGEPTGPTGELQLRRPRQRHASE